MTTQFSYLGHSILITTISPLSNAYNLCKLFDNKIHFRKICKHTVPIITPQILLRYAQLNVGALVNFHNPLLGFGFIGALQGIIYGHANSYYNKVLFGKPFVRSNMFRGTIFASGRDIISQGIPFVYSSKISNYFGIKSDLGKLAIWSSTSLLSILSSHFLHNLQLIMHSNENIRYIDTLKKLQNPTIFWKGVEGRLILLLATNALNEFFLKDVWKT